MNSLEERLIAYAILAAQAAVKYEAEFGQPYFTPDEILEQWSYWNNIRHINGVREAFEFYYLEAKNRLVRSLWTLSNLFNVRIIYIK